MATINLLSKSSRDKILKSNIIADESGVGLKVTEQEAQKTLDISTSNIIVEINNVYADKIKIAQKKAPLGIRFVYIFPDSFLRATARTRDLKINVEGYAIAPGGYLYFMIDNGILFEDILIKEQIQFEKKRAIVIGVIYPIPGGFNKILNVITPNIQYVFQSEIGELIIIPVADETVEPSLEAIRKLMGL